MRRDALRRSTIATLVLLAAATTNPLSASATGEDPPGTETKQYNMEGRRILGTVVWTSEVSGYTYVQLDTADGVVWAAAPRTPVEEGDMVLLPDGSPMAGFYSSSLERRFDLIYFASAMHVGENEESKTVDLSQHCAPGKNTGLELDYADIERATGGLTISEIVDQKKDLAGSEVSLRGKVVKCIPGILGKTWIHLRDGTLGKDGTGDVAVTTTATASVGDTVLVRGVVALDRDFGYGYRYDLLIEDATITNE